MTPLSLVADFAELFSGRKDAIGLGRGGVQRRAIMLDDYAEHLEGKGDGIGIFPLRDDGTVSFAAIDLDEPDFEAAKEMAALLPGVTWIERSRSGNAHVWAFFEQPIEAWVPRGLMKMVLESMGRDRVEVFPKQDRLLPGMVGNYINLPYHGGERRVLSNLVEGGFQLETREFIHGAFSTRNPVDTWRRRAEYMGIEAPSRSLGRSHEFGEAEQLHECALYIIEGVRSGERPITAGHRSVVYFNLAKQLLNWSEMNEEDAWDLLQEVEAVSPDPIPQRELQRIFRNAASGRWTSTGCDDPLMAPYVSPTCPIAHGVRA